MLCSVLAGSGVAVHPCQPQVKATEGNNRDLIAENVTQTHHKKASRVTESMSDFHDLHQADTVMMTCYRTNCLEEDFSALKESDKRRATFLLRPLWVKKKREGEIFSPSKEKQVPSSSPPCRVSSFQPLASPFVDGHHSMTCPASPPSTTCVSRGGGK